MFSNEEIIEKIADAMVVFRENRQICNVALSLAKGRMESLSKEVIEKDNRIAELEEKLDSYREGCAMSTATDDGWVACSEKLPEIGKVVMIQMTSPLLHPKIGYLSGDGKSWWVIMGALNGGGKIEADAVIAWRELPKRYEPPVVEEEPVEEEVEFESGDYVVCISNSGSKVHAIYIDEDKEVYRILDKSSFHPQDILKTHWHLKRCDKYVSTMEWLLTKED